MDIIGSILELPKQCEQALTETRELQFPPEYSQADNIVVCGMGGSTLPSHILKSFAKFKAPFVINNDYELPTWANGNTLVLLASYSGTTEEVLACAKQAKSLGCLITGVTSGGKLAAFLKENNSPAYVFEPKYNTTRQPRLGVGYGLFGQMGVLENIGLMKGDTGTDVALQKLQSSSEQIRQSAESFAKRIKDHALLIFGARHLEGNAHTFANQTNESSKAFAFWFAIPESNHHLLESVKHTNIPTFALFLESDNYPDKIKKRFAITRELVEKSGWTTETYTPSSGTLLEEVLDVLLFSSLITTYLAKVYGENPLAIPNVDYFKEKLG